ncbi:predicted protein [Naegleria gruberi]|uniref:Predicted protein n=1 Tax=Naegleria gruberi TaxID=5762 RepID=D2VXH5_NAEGR|nr:uncharacterized protein NAEGRDRAFT_59504 [Naegleria gruberi]EFC38441.1 predicted protein [Naegleria gruberi]|eukprot:XP_002671185.1 predicted protein [Naegleria gruberi strain NEG-M]
MIANQPTTTTSSSLEDTNSTIDIVVVGAGPVGLWTSCQIKLLNPKLNIRILEKHEEYKRSHVVVLHHKSLEGHVAHPTLNNFRKEVTENTKIRTNRIEQTLSNLCKELNIEIFKNFNVNDMKSIESMFPNARFIIGADGSHSTVRGAVCGGELEYTKHFHTLVEVKYEAIGQTKSLNTVMFGYPTMKLIGFIVFELIGKVNKEGNTPVTLQFFVDEELGNQIKNATFKNPLMFDKNRHELPDEVRNAVETWIAIRKKACDENAEMSSIKITTTKLAAYASNTFVKCSKSGGPTYCLVGDAAFGMPFFRSLNNGMLCGTELAQAISLDFAGMKKKESIFKSLGTKISGVVSQQIGGRTSPSEGPVSDTMVEYANYVRMLEQKEYNLAKIKSSGLVAFRMFTRVSSKVPWQTNKFSQEEIDEINKCKNSYSDDNRVSSLMDSL